MPLQITTRPCSVEGCTMIPRKWATMCMAHANRKARYGDPLGGGRYLPSNRTAEDRFWEMVNKAGPIPENRPALGPCWVWTGSRDKHGYGRFGVIPGKTVLAHAFLFPVPEGMERDHLCRTRSCVRQSHLEAVTHAENIRRGEGHLVGARVSERYRNGELRPWRLDLESCPNGHTYTEANTLRTTRGRKCRMCNEGRQARWKAKQLDAGIITTL